MYELTHEFRFEATHQLPAQEGESGHPHRHVWRGWLILKGSILMRHGPEVGMLVCPWRISQLLAPVISDLDHCHLNEFVPEPTREKVARYIFDRLYSVALGDPHLADLMAGLTVETTLGSRCTYWRGPL
jgi:6-pyruvoyl-tetrahydropterin synthase